MAINLVRPQSSAVCLLSGGLDSPVAMYLMIQKGVTPIALFFDSQLMDPKSQRLRAIFSIQKLSKFLPEKKIHFITIPYDHAMKEFFDNGNPKYICVHCKRYMYRTASVFAERNQIPVIVTGEIIGEQASQTLDNLMVIQYNTRLPLLRPLVGFDKNDILRIAHQIGTYEASTLPANACGYTPSKPVVNGLLEVIVEDEKKFDFPSLIEKSLVDAYIELVPS